MQVTWIIPYTVAKIGRGTINCYNLFSGDPSGQIHSIDGPHPKAPNINALNPVYVDLSPTRHYSSVGGAQCGIAVSFHDLFPNQSLSEGIIAVSSSTTSDYETDEHCKPQGHPGLCVHGYREPAPQFHACFLQTRDVIVREIRRRLEGPV